MLYKAIGITLAALFLATLNISVASAGCGGGHGGYHVYKSKAPSRAALQQSRRKAAVAEARATAKKKAVQQAKIEKKSEAEKVAATEPGKPEETTKVAAVEQTCTKFFAETGTTVTVECAKQ